MRVLGLDLGTTSVGFALIEWQENSAKGHIVRMGVRIFPEGVLQDQSNRYPPNQTRREKRLARRTLRRRRLRRRLLREALYEMGLLPAFSKDKCSDWAKAMGVQKKDKEKRQKDHRIDPYTLRKRALTERLEPWELGRVLYHLGKRRGFRGRDIEDDADPEKKKEEKGIKAEIEGLRAKIGDSTLGAWLADLSPGERKRGRHTHRGMYEKEFCELWKAQERYHDALTPERKEEIKNIIFNQRPVFWRLNTLGKCRFFPGEMPAPKSAWTTQQFTMLEQINKLRIAGGNARPLDDEERRIVVNLAQSQATVSFGAIRKALKPYWKERGNDLKQKFNLEASEKHIKGNALEAKLVAKFGDRWADHPMKERIRSDLHDRLFHADYVQLGNKRVEIRRAGEQQEARKRAADAMVHDWRISREQATTLSELTLPAGWARISTKAIKAMLPEMERGIGVGELTMSPEWEEWRRTNFPDMARPTGEIWDELPSPASKDGREFLAGLRNPTVNRTLNEVRKVVNNLIRTYGKPDRIRVELARELRQPKKKREATDKRNRMRQAQRKKAKAELEKNGIPTSGRNIEKWLLWKECSELCPYTGKKISFDALFRKGLFDIEHIWPRGRSLDNSFLNKTLCDVAFNRHVKGDRTPFEIFSRNDDEMYEFRKRLESCFGDIRNPRNPNITKIKRFLAPGFIEAGSEEFSERQLRDTAYAARIARDYLKRLYPDDGSVPLVETCNGAITAQLRYAWGLKKDRADHRHHAIDALAVACTTPAFVKRLSDWNKKRDQGLRPDLPKPWPGFTQDALRMREKIIVSHRVRKRVSGALHAETYYGNTGNDDGEYRFFVTRKPVEKLSADEIKNPGDKRVTRFIRDKRVREIIQEHVAKNGGLPKKAFPPYPRVSEKGPEIKKVRLLVKQQPSLVKRVPAGYVDPDANHHMAIYREADGSINYEVVPLFEAMRRLSRQEPVIRKKSETGGTLIMSLSPGDTLEFPPDDGSDRPSYRVVTGVWAAGPIVLEDHFTADGTVWKRPKATSIISAGARKVSVDPIGRVRRARD